MPQTTVLIGFAEAMSAPEVTWSLVDAGCRVVAFTRKGRPSALRHSRHVKCHEISAPEVDLQASRSDLQALMESLDSNGTDTRFVILPLDDKSVWLAKTVELGNRWKLAGPTGAAAELALNKCIQVQMARDAGFNVPETALAKSAKDVFDFCQTLTFPIILRAAECVPIREGRVRTCRNWICANTSELERAVKEWGDGAPLLVQPFIEGVGEGIFGLATPGGIRAWSAHRRLRMMNPQGSGSSACASQALKDDLKALAERLIEAAGWQGLFMIELLRDKSGKVWFVELNGRTWGSMALSRRQGFEYPAWAVKLALGEESEAATRATAEPGAVCRNVGRDFIHVLFVLRGAKSKALTNWPPIWKTVASVMRFHAGDSYYNWRRDDRSVFFADTYYTIHDNLFKAGN
jgi:predicted ATP-grasp superfamily ATP-dependent carboligase